jgi:hypothetical protein
VNYCGIRSNLRIGNDVWFKEVILMADKIIPIVSSTKQSKIVRYKLEEDCVNLRKNGLSYQDIADELNNSGKVPPTDPVDKFVVMRFLEKVPEITRQLVQEDKNRLLNVVNTNFDIIHEISMLFGKTKALLEMMEEDADAKGKTLNPYQFKAVASEMREMLNQMMMVQKEVNDFNNIKKFMEIVIDILKEEAPDKLPIIAEKLRTTKGTQWFADMVSKGGN